MGLMYLRRTRPDLVRPFRVSPYPFLPICFIISAAFITGSALISDTVPSIMAIVFILLGVPLYVGFFWKGNLVWKYLASQMEALGEKRRGETAQMEDLEMDIVTVEQEEHAETDDDGANEEDMSGDEKAVAMARESDLNNRAEMDNSDGEMEDKSLPD